MGQKNSLPMEGVDGFSVEEVNKFFIFLFLISIFAFFIDLSFFIIFLIFMIFEGYLASFLRAIKTKYT